MIGALPGFALEPSGRLIAERGVGRNFRLDAFECGDDFVPQCLKPGFRALLARINFDGCRHNRCDPPFVVISDDEHSVALISKRWQAFVTPQANVIVLSRCLTTWPHEMNFWPRRVDFVFAGRLSNSRHAPTTNATRNRRCLRALRVSRATCFWSGSFRSRPKAECCPLLRRRSSTSPKVTVLCLELEKQMAFPAPGHDDLAGL